MANTTTSMTRSYVDPAVLMRIKNLPLRAKTVVEGFYNGLHRSPYHGFSAEFSEHRPYTHGDNPRYLDWRLLARTDREYIKQFEEETNRCCHLVVDMSRSMEYGSVGYSKLDYARTLAATLAKYLLLQRDAVGLISFASEIIDRVPAKIRTGQLHHVCVALDKKSTGHDTDVVRPIEQLAGWVRRRGLVILVSDLLAPIDRLPRSLAQLHAVGHEVMLFLIVDRGELSLDWDEPSVLIDVETQRRLFVDPSVAAENYRRRFQGHHTAIADICANTGVHLCMMRTDEPLEHALLQLLMERVDRNERLHRSRASMGGGRR